MKKIYIICLVAFSFLLGALLSVQAERPMPIDGGEVTPIDLFIRTNGQSETRDVIPFEYGADFKPQSQHMPAITFGDELTGIGSYQTGLGSIVFYMYGGILGEMVQVSPTEVIIDWMDITIFQEDVILEADLIANQQSGEGNDYACFDENGRLFRKEDYC